MSITCGILGFAACGRSTGDGLDSQSGVGVGLVSAKALGIGLGLNLAVGRGSPASAPRRKYGILHQLKGSGIERGGRITLTELGRQIIDPQYERAAKAEAFLRVPLFAKVYENFKGRPMPPPAALERAMIGYGVGSKVGKNARQVLMRSAQQAGYFELSQDRLTAPPNRGSALPEQPYKDETEKGGGGGAGNGNGGSDGLDLDPLILALLRKIPSRKEKWPVEKRLRWFKTFAMNVSQVYDDEDENPVELLIEVRGINAA